VQDTSPRRGQHSLSAWTLPLSQPQSFSEKILFFRVILLWPHLFRALLHGGGQRERVECKPLPTAHHSPKLGAHMSLGVGPAGSSPPWPQDFKPPHTPSPGGSKCSNQPPWGQWIHPAECGENRIKGQENTQKRLGYLDGRSFLRPSLHLLPLTLHTLPAAQEETQVQTQIPRLQPDPGCSDWPPPDLGPVHPEESMPGPSASSRLSPSMCPQRWGLLFLPHPSIPHLRMRRAEHLQEASLMSTPDSGDGGCVQGSLPVLQDLGKNQWLLSTC
jgi:hypothetical protein